MNTRAFFQWLGPQPLMQVPVEHEVLVIEREGWIVAIDGALPDPTMDWVGEPLSLFKSQYPSLKLQVVQASQLEHAWRKKEPSHSFLQEWRRLAASVFQDEKGLKRAVHPLLAGLQSPWLKVLPRHFTIYVCLEGHQQRHALFEIKQGQLVDFSVPDFQSLETATVASMQERVQHIKRYRSEPVQGVRMTKEFWSQLVQSSDPWSMCTRGLKRGVIHLTPKRLSLSLWLRMMQVTARNTAE